MPALTHPPVLASPVSRRLRALADAMQPAIEAKLSPAIAEQNPTQRRARIAEGMRRDGQRLQLTQAVLRQLAEERDYGQIDPLLLGLTSRAAVDAVLSASRWPGHDAAAVKALTAAGVTETTFVAVERALEMIARPLRATGPADPIAAAERELIGLEIPGFYPTPRWLVEQMIGMADIAPGMSVLEPSAGAGDIATVVRELHPRAHVHTVERHPRLAALLRLKGFQVQELDFLSVAPDARDRYDRILMNPPFERHADIQHVRHAYLHWLAPGGTLIGLMSPGPFVRSGAMAEQWRAWFAEHHGSGETHEQVQFNRLGKGTTLTVRLVVLDKPAD